MKVNIKKLHPDAVIPTYSKDGDVGMDLTVVDIWECDDYYEVKFGIAVEIPEGYFGLEVPRSSVTKMNMMLKNSVGIIDSGYRGELVARFKKVKSEDGSQVKFYEKGDRAAQLIILPYPQIEFNEVKELAISERGDGGFGHTGK